MSKQYRGLTGAGLAPTKAVSIEAVPRLTGKLGLLKVIVEKTDRGQNCLKINQPVKDTEIYRTVELKWTGPSRIRDNSHQS